MPLEDQTFGYVMSWWQKIPFFYAQASRAHYSRDGPDGPNNLLAAPFLQNKTTFRFAAGKNIANRQQSTMAIASPIVVISSTTMANIHPYILYEVLSRQSRTVVAVRGLHNALDVHYRWTYQKIHTFVLKIGIEGIWRNRCKREYSLSF